MRRLRRLLAGLEVDVERMRANLESSRGVVFSQPVLLALVRSGMTRDEAYRIVQGAALRSWDERIGFRDVLESEHDLDAAVLDEAFDLDRSLANLGPVHDRLDELGAPR